MALQTQRRMPVPAGTTMTIAFVFVPLTLGLCRSASECFAADRAADPVRLESSESSVKGLEEGGGAFPGYTLIAPLMSTTTYLVDLDRRIVHRWQSDCTPGASAYLLENGHLLRTGSLGGGRRGGGPGMAGAAGGPPGRGGGRGGFGGGGGAGGRVQEFTWDGQLVWDFTYAGDDYLLHHDVALLPNGNIVMLGYERKTAEQCIAAGRRPASAGTGDIRPDFLIEVKPTGETTGEIVWQWRIWDHLIQDHDPDKPNFGEVGAHPELIDVNFPEGGGAGQDWTHTNAVAYNPGLDQIMLSVLGFNELWVIDHSTTAEEAAGHSGGRSGKGGDLLYRWGNPRAYRAGSAEDQRLFGQHDAHWIAAGLPGEGHILVFNNGSRRPDGRYSSVDELVAPVDEQGRYAREPGATYGPAEPVWSYTAPTKADFFSMNISGAQRLPNGNTLICSGANGIFFEVTAQKETVWRYVFSEAGGSGRGGGGFGAPRRGQGEAGPPPDAARGMAGPPPDAAPPEGGPLPDDPWRGWSGSGGEQPPPRVAPPRGRGGAFGGFGARGTQVFRIYRYAPDYPGLADKDLTPEKPVEEPQ